MYVIYRVDGTIDQKRVDFEIDFKCDLGGFWERKWKQVGTQKRSTIEAATKAEKSIEH